MVLFRGAKRSLRRSEVHWFHILVSFIDKKLEKVILICGPSWSGKWTLAKYLQEKHGSILYQFSHPLHTILSDLDIPNTRDNLGKLSLSLRQNFGEHILGFWAHEFVEKNKWALIVMEWIRRIESLDGWEEMIDHIIWIESSPNIRYERMRIRWEKSKEDILTYEDFFRQESWEAEQSLGKLRDRADIMIENNFSLEELYADFERYFTRP